jgi:hypothetical protein
MSGWLWVALAGSSVSIRKACFTSFFIADKSSRLSEINGFTLPVPPGAEFAEVSAILSDELAWLSF